MLVLCRGDKEDILALWFKMYDTDRDGFLAKQVYNLTIYYLKASTTYHVKA